MGGVGQQTVLNPPLVVTLQFAGQSTSVSPLVSVAFTVQLAAWEQSMIREPAEKGMLMTHVEPGPQ